MPQRETPVYSGGFARTESGILHASTSRACQWFYNHRTDCRYGHPRHPGRRGASENDQLRGLRPHRFDPGPGRIGQDFDQPGQVDHCGQGRRHAWQPGQHHVCRPRCGHQDAGLERLSRPLVRRHRHRAAGHQDPDRRLLSFAQCRTTGDYTFYGYGNSQIPGGDAGWRIENAPDPKLCSVQYTYNGSGVPVVTANTSGC